jgi:uncharacterized membrane protein
VKITSIRTRLYFTGLLLLCCAIAFTILQLIIQKEHPKNTQLEIAFRKMMTKGIFSLIGYVSGVGLAFVNTTVSLLIFFIVAIVWLSPTATLKKQLPMSNASLHV